jgi:hypothetical protein
MERSGDAAAGTSAADLIESDPAGELGWDVWKRGFPFPGSPILPTSRPIDRWREFASRIESAGEPLGDRHRHPKSKAAIAVSTIAHAMGMRGLRTAVS